MATSSSLVRLELLWKHVPGDLAGAIHAAGETLRSLDQGGFVIGVGADFANASSYVHADQGVGTVSIHAWFVGPGAWKAALIEHHTGPDGGGVFSINDFGLRTVEPKIIDRTKGLRRPGWTIRGSLRNNPELVIRADAGLMTPPLISADHRLIPLWNLGLTHDTRIALHTWNVQARAVALLAPAFEDEGIYRKWAKQQLYQKRSELALEAKRLASLVTKESGFTVRVGPLIDPMGGF